MGASLVYLGEHYVLDVLAGILCSLAAVLAGRAREAIVEPSLLGALSRDRRS